MNSGSSNGNSIQLRQLQRVFIIIIVTNQVVSKVIRQQGPPSWPRGGVDYDVLATQSTVQSTDDQPTEDWSILFRVQFIKMV